MSGRDSTGRREEDLRAGVRELLKELLGSGGVTDEENLFARGLDSMKRLELLAMLEERFGVALTEDLTAQFDTVPRIVRALAHASAGLSASRVGADPGDA